MLELSIFRITLVFVETYTCKLLYINVNIYFLEVKENIYFLFLQFFKTAMELYPAIFRGITETSTVLSSHCTIAYTSESDIRQFDHYLRDVRVHWVQ